METNNFASYDNLAAFDLKQISLSVPTPKATIFQKISNFKVKFNSFFFAVFSRFKRNRVSEGVATSSDGGYTPRRSRKLPVGKIGKAIVFLVVIAGLVFYLPKMFKGRQATDADGDKISIKGARSEETINREFEFPLRDGEGEEITKIKYIIENAELRDEIVIKGQRANSVAGRTFLVITIKINNEYNLPLKINSKDYVRLSVNGNKDEWLAADIHSDPVDVQAISTKYTRLGFPISDSDSNLVLRVGEINGEKQEVEISLQ